MYLQERLAVCEQEDAQEQKKGDPNDKKHEILYDVISDQEMVDRVFGFLPSFIAGQEGQAPVGFEVKDMKKM